MNGDGLVKFLDSEQNRRMGMLALALLGRLGCEKKSFQIVGHR
jgi:hypothetical protein